MALGSQLLPFRPSHSLTLLRSICVLGKLLYNRLIGKLIFSS
jgi:hypothetical protein